MILRSCGVLRHNGSLSEGRVGFIVGRRLCERLRQKPWPGLLRALLHRGGGELLFSLFKGFPALPAPIIAPIDEKAAGLKWRVMEHVKSASVAVMFADDRRLR